MRIARLTASPRVVFVGDEPVLVSPPSLRMLGMIFAFLEDTIPPPDGAADDWCPSLEDPASGAALAAETGMPIVLHSGMARDHPEARLADAFRAAPRLSPEDAAKVQEIVLTRHRPAPRQDVSAWKSAIPKGEPINRVNLGRLVERACLAGFAPDTIMNWTLDQLENKLQGGEPDVEDLEREGVPLAEAEVAAWSARMKDPEELARVAVERGEPIPPEVLARLDPSWVAELTRPRVAPPNLPELASGPRRMPGMPTPENPR